MERVTKFANFFRINYRVLLWLLIFLLLLDQWVVWAFDRQIKGDGVFRLAAEEKHVISSYLDKIAADQGRKVLFIGDSVMYGSAALSDRETIPAYVAEQAQKKWPNEAIRFYNLGFKGLSIADAYFLLKLLEDRDAHFDLIVYDANIGWINDNLINRKLILELADSDQIDWQDLAMEKPSSSLSSFINDDVLRYWKLYYYNHMINYWLFGKPVTKKIREATHHFYYPEVVTEDDIFHLPWYEKQWDQKFKGDWKLGRIPYDNKQWVYFDRLLVQMKSMSTDSMLFIIPRNHQLLDEYDRIDYEAMEIANNKITELADINEVYAVNYEYLVDNQLFSDTIHPLPKGNEMIATQLIVDINRLGILLR